MLAGYILISILPTALIIAAVNDILEMKIPNFISLCLLWTFPVAAAFFQIGWESFFVSSLYAVAVLTVGFIFFLTIQFGAGDAKLLAATALWAGPGALLEFLVGVGLAGGALAMFVLFLRQAPFIPAHSAFNWLDNLQRKDRRIPYGIAIAVGGLLVLPNTMFAKVIFGG